VRRVRVMLQVAGMLGPAGCLLLAVSPAVGASPALASQLITVGLGLSALTLGGVSVSHLDVAPRHAGGCLPRTTPGGHSRVGGRAGGRAGGVAVRCVAEPRACLPTPPAHPTVLASFC
jgi:hypothetical protein